MTKKLFMVSSVLVVFGLLSPSLAMAAATPWSDLTDPAANLSLSMQGNTSAFTWGSTTGSDNLMTLQDSAGNTGIGYVLSVGTAAGSTASPLQVVAGGNNALVVAANGNVGIGTSAPTARTEVVSGSDSQVGLQVDPSSPTQTSPAILVSRVANNTGPHVGANSLNLALQVNKRDNTTGMVTLQGVWARPFDDEAKLRVGTGTGSKIADFYTQTGVQTNVDLYDAVTGNVGLKFKVQSGSGGGLGTGELVTGPVFFLGANGVEGNIISTTTLGTSIFRINTLAPIQDSQLTVLDSTLTTGSILNAKNFLGHSVYKVKYETAATGSTASASFLDNAGNTKIQISPTLDTYFNGPGKFGIGTSTPQAALDVSSTTSGFLPPRMTQTQRDAIVSPVEGSVIYNLTSHKLNVYTGTWEAITSN